MKKVSKDDEEGEKGGLMIGLGRCGASLTLFAVIQKTRSLGRLPVRCSFG